MAVLFLTMRFAGAEAVQYIRCSENTLRKFATKRVLPEYPADAIKRRETGVVVVDVYLEHGGTLAKVAIVDSPSTSLATIVEQALSKWTFQVGVAAWRRYTVVGKLTFYFVNCGEQYRVFDSQDAPQPLCASNR